MGVWTHKVGQIVFCCIKRTKEPEKSYNFVTAILKDAGEHHALLILCQYYVTENGISQNAVHCVAT